MNNDELHKAAFTGALAGAIVGVLLAIVVMSLALFG